MKVYLLFQQRWARVFPGPREDSPEGWVTFVDQPLPPAEAAVAWDKLAHVLRRIAGREEP